MGVKRGSLFWGKNLSVTSSYFKHSATYEECKNLGRYVPMKLASYFRIVIKIIKKEVPT